ncbi:MAG TPA: hypothetical protein VMI54_30965 [Polyangiaceae bacterium]|nr:hypothetical protein [Polyangiaceae bacterium]
MSPKILLAVVPFFVLACGNKSGDDDSGGAGSGGSSVGSGGSTSLAGGGGTTGGTSTSLAGGGGTTSGGQCASGTLALQSANNYAFTSNITLTPLSIKANEPNLDFDWSGVTTDFLGRKTDPAKDVDSVLLAVLSLTIDQFETHLNNDDFLRPFVPGALQLLTNQTLTKANLEDFGVPTQPENTYKSSPDVQTSVMQYLAPATADSPKILALMPSTGTDPGHGARMIQVLVLDPNSTTTSVTLGPDTVVPAGTNGHTGGTTGPSASVTYDANLHALTPIKIAAGSTDLMVDWNALTMNGLGHDWVSRSIGEITVGHYTQSITELENQFLSLQDIATTMYTGYVPSDDPISLTGLKDDQGNVFQGIDNTGTWILALFCSPMNCSNPAPWFLTVLQTCN